jgi:DNA-directed RNA polymerase subunit RPC12/RpoP
VGEIKKAMEVYVEAKYVKCPHCDAKIGGWEVDPRGARLQCDECKKTFSVSMLADVWIIDEEES